MPALREKVEQSPLNIWTRGEGRIGVITHGVNTLFVEEVAAGRKFDVLSLGFTHPLPLELIRRFRDSVNGPVYVIEDGHRFIQEGILAAGIEVRGKDEDETVME